MIGHVFKSLWAAVRYFVLGLAAAVLYAPRKGDQSRQMMRDSILGAFDKVLPTSHQHDDVNELDKQEYWESDAPPEQHEVLNDLKRDANSQQHPVL